MKTLAALALAAALPIGGLAVPAALPAPEPAPFQILDDDDFGARRGMLQRLVERVGGGLRDRLEQGLDELGVTDAQRDAMRAVVEQHADSLRAKRSAELDARRALLDASMARPTDPAAIHVASQDLATAMAEARIASGMMRDEVRALLTPEQLAELDAKRDGWMDRLDDLRAQFGR